MHLFCPMKLAPVYPFNMSVLILATGLSVLHAAPIPAGGAPLPPLESFFSESARFAERLSPHGDRIAYLGPDATGISRLWVVQADHPQTPVRVSPADGSAVVAFFWLGDDTLLWQARGPTGRSHLLLQASPGCETREILSDEQRVITLEGVVDGRAPCILVGLSVGPAAFPDLFRVHLGGNERPELICANRHRIITWAWDAGGTPVAGLRWTADGAKEIVRLRDGTVVFRAEPADDARLLSATADGSQVLVITNRDADLTRLERIDLSTGKGTALAADPQGRVDIEQVIADAKGTILAASYADEAIRWQALDPAFSKLLATVDGVPDTRHMTCLGFDAAQTRCLLKRFSSQDPGTIYLYDAASRSLRMLWRERPELNSATLCETKAFDYPARDGTPIPAFLTVPRDIPPPWPVVVFPHGGPRMRTSPGFDGRVQFLASRGYAVLQPNFRGSRGYGKAFMNAGDGQWGRGGMQTDVTDAVDHLIAAGMADKHRVASSRRSMGSSTLMLNRVEHQEPAIRLAFTTGPGASPLRGQRTVEAKPLGIAVLLGLIAYGLVGVLFGAGPFRVDPLLLLVLRYIALVLVGILTYDIGRRFFSVSRATPQSVPLAASARSSSQRRRPLAWGGGISSGSKDTAPAHSPPMRSSRAKSLPALIPRIEAIRSRGSASGKRPAKKPRTTRPVNESLCSGNCRESGWGTALASHAASYTKTGSSLSARTPTLSPSR